MSKAAPTGLFARVPTDWRTLSPVARGLLGARFVRSVMQGAMAVDFVLYLRALHWSASGIGLLLTAESLAAALLGVAAGWLSDRVGRRPLLLLYEALVLAITGALWVFPFGPVLVAAAILGGFGRGANGAAGPFGPVEQAWLAESVPAPARGRVFSANAAAGFWGMGLGSLLAAALTGGKSSLHAAAFRPLFLLALAVAAGNLVQVARLPAGRRVPAPESAAHDRRLRRRENRALVALTAVNAVNALAVGLFGPLLPYWFALRYGVGPSAIGSVYGLTFFLTGLSALATGELAARQGLVRSIVALRLTGVAALLALPLMPSYPLAAGLYVLRSMVNRGSVGARQAFAVGLVRDRRRGLASSLNAVSWSLPSAMGPAITGPLLDQGTLEVPFFLAAGLQLLYVLLLSTVLARYEQPLSEEG